jgi:hypothetical protein
MLIGISGKKQCGKDTVCKIIKALDIWNRYGDGDMLTFVKMLLKTPSPLGSIWYKHAYADKLKQVLSIILNVDVVAFEDNIFKMSSSEIAKPEGGYYTNRELLQRFGTEVGRSISPTLWVDALFTSYSEDDHWIIPDVRFPSEAKAIKDRGGIVIRVDRETLSHDNHPSETALDDYEGFDYRIDNNSDIEHLIDKVKGIMFQLNLI